jgi:NAD(P)-dependent dehydrogenase (short-subunit alcohol dehydrogenase family)
MSKAALNQLTKTMAVELGRKSTIVASLHPGTVDTDLSRAFTKNVPHKFTPKESVDAMMKVIDSLKPEDNGSFKDYQGKSIVW